MESLRSSEMILVLPLIPATETACRKNDKVTALSFILVLFFFREFGGYRSRTNELISDFTSRDVNLLLVALMENTVASVDFEKFPGFLIEYGAIPEFRFPTALFCERLPLDCKQNRSDESNYGFQRRE